MNIAVSAGTVSDADANPVENATVYTQSEYHFSAVAISDIYPDANFPSERAVIEYTPAWDTHFFIGDDVLFTGITGSVGNVLNGNSHLFRIVSVNSNPDCITVEANVFHLTYSGAGAIDKTAYFNDFALTDANGNYTGYTTYSNSTVSSIRVSKPGYEMKLLNTITDPMAANFQLAQIHNNDWSLRYENPVSNNMGYDATYSVDANGLLNSSPDVLIPGWTFSAGDNIIKGDFTGDGNDDLLLANGSGMALLEFQSGKWVETDQSMNNGNSSWSSLYSHRLGKFIVGNFDGGTEEELLLNGGSSGNWLLFRYSNGTWSQAADDNQSLSNEIRNYKDYIVAGDFDNDGYDDLIGVKIAGSGARTMAWFKYAVNSGTGLATLQEHDHGYSNNSSYPISFLTPYSDRLITGDLDADGDDEIIGETQSSAAHAYFDLVSNTVSLIFDDSDPNSGFYQMRTFKGKLIAGDFYHHHAGEELLGMSTDGAMAFRRFRNDFEIFWDGQNNPMGDWSYHLNPPGTLNSNGPNTQFFVHVMPEVPDYLFNCLTTGTVNSATTTLSKMYAYMPPAPCSDPLHRPQQQAAVPVPVSEKQDMKISPNPGDKNFTVTVTLPGPLPLAAQLELWTPLGQVILRQEMGVLFPGTYSFPFTAPELADGIYYLKLSGGKTTAVRKLVIRH